ncbi:hypothetical protein BFJ69_g2240 [Fusarium oxysporum]|uniref:Uncharacterized protein n=1 Tax=Fusarium oxysporum TaxID=5507 RepID=A0A420NUL2_FUSOX|nr:hypothetical protein BFJ69_g2240 [Fusarium oxysporum]
MGLLAKLKFKLRKRLAQGTAEPVAHGILGLVSLERVCKAPSGIDRGRNQSFFAMNAPQGNPFAAAGALHMPFPSQLHQQPFTGQQFGPPVMTPNSLERACKVYCSSLCSVNSVLTMDRCSLTPEYTRRVTKIATMQAAEYASKRATATMHLLLHLIDQACLPRALVALESQLVRLCEICTVCLDMNGVHIIAYSVELAHSFELRHQRNQDFDGLRTLDTPHTLTLSLSHSLKCLGGLA